MRKNNKIAYSLKKVISIAPTYSTEDIVTIFLTGKELSKLLDSYKSFNKLVTSLLNPRTLSSDQKKAILEALNKKIEDHLFTTPMADSKLAKRARNWDRILEQNETIKFSSPHNDQNLFLRTIAHRYINERHLKSSNPSHARAFAFTEGLGIKDANEMLRKVMFQEASRITSPKQLEKLLAHFDDSDPFRTLLKLQFELARHSEKKAPGKTDRSKEISGLVENLIGNNDKWQTCQNYEPIFDKDPSKNKAALAQFRAINHLPDFPIQDLILAVQTARGFRDGTLVVKDAQQTQRVITPTEAAAFHNFCNSSYFSHLGLIPRPTPDSTYLSQVRAFKETYYIEGQPNNELTTNPVIVARDTQQIHFFNAYTEVSQPLTSDTVHQIVDPQVKKVVETDLLISSLENEAKDQHPEAGKKISRQDPLRKRIKDVVHTSSDPQVLEKALSVFEQRKKAAAVQTTQSGTLQKAASVTSESSEECTLDELTYIVRQLQKRIAICEEKLSALDRVLLDCQKEIQKSKVRLGLLDIEVPVLKIPEEIKGAQRKFLQTLRNQIKTDLDVATSGYLNDEYTQNPSSLHNCIGLAATLGDVFFGFGTIIGTLVTAVTDKVQSNQEEKKLNSLIDARAALDVSNQGLANLIVLALIDIIQQTLAEKLNSTLKPGFVVRLSANIVKHLKENSRKDIEFTKSSSGDSITFSTEYKAKLKQRVLDNLV